MGPGGYAWWYVDALSEDGQHGLVVIAFIGSVFSPYYLAAGKARPTDHVAVNVALYGRSARRWAMTERGEASLSQAADHLAIGPSDLSWDGQSLAIRIRERGAVFRQRVEGEVRLWPEALVGSAFDLDGARRHRWAPVATRARVEARFDRPALSWSGDAYLDSNSGSEPMERAFRRWDWSRAHGPDGALVFYEGEEVNGRRFGLALRFGADGRAEPVDAPGAVRLAPTRWLMPRTTRSEAGARVLSTWEDTPFYSRSVLEVELGGHRLHAVHESLSLSRFVHPAVQWMLPFRMPRARHA